MTACVCGGVGVDAHSFMQLGGVVGGFFYQLDWVFPACDGVCVCGGGVDAQSFMQLSYAMQIVEVCACACACACACVRVSVCVCVGLCG